jgi:alkyl sulfatase BDS1-like metallo-beta-lactamase superfamily hydrolase
VAWDVRAIWENYSGWFHHRSTTELYPVGPESVSPDVVELAGAEALIARARAHLDSGRPLQAIHLAEIVLHTDPENPRCRAVLKDAHAALLADSVNFWESAWLTAAITRYS